jgi:hypothetical protein
MAKGLSNSNRFKSAVYVMEWRMRTKLVILTVNARQDKNCEGIEAEAGVKMVYRDWCSWVKANDFNNECNSINLITFVLW